MEESLINTNQNILPDSLLVVENKPKKKRIRFKFRFPRLSSGQLKKLSDIVADIGLVSLASVVFPPILGRLEGYFLIIGIPITLFFWIMSLYLLEK